MSGSDKAWGGRADKTVTDKAIDNKDAELETKIGKPNMKQAEPSSADSPGNQ